MWPPWLCHSSYFVLSDRKSFYLDNSCEKQSLNDTSKHSDTSFFVFESGNYLSNYPTVLHKGLPVSINRCKCHVSICIHTAENNRQVWVSTLTDDHFTWAVRSPAASHLQKLRLRNDTCRCSYLETSHAAGGHSGRMWMCSAVSLQSQYFILRCLLLWCSECKRILNTYKVTVRAHFHR